MVPAPSERTPPPGAPCAPPGTGVGVGAGAVPSTVSSAGTGIAPESTPAGWEEEVRQHREVWRAKPLLRRVYQRWFAAVRAATVPGRTLEIGGGSGNFRESWPELMSCDIVRTAWLDFQADGMALPLATGALDNVVGVDVLHHVQDPDRALAELARVVRPGGRIVLVEPYVSWFSGLVRGRYHHEHQDLTREVVHGPDKAPDEANLAIPTLIFVRGRTRLPERFPRLRLVDLRFHDMLVYPLTGGFSRPTLLPEPLLGALYRLGTWVAPWCGALRRACGFKMQIVLEVRPRLPGGEARAGADAGA